MHTSVARRQIASSAIHVHSWAGQEWNAGYIHMHTIMVVHIYHAHCRYKTGNYQWAEWL